MSRPFDYITFEEELETLLAQGLFQEWRPLGPGHYRIDEEIDVWPKSKTYGYFKDKSYGKYETLRGIFTPAGVRR